MVLAKSYRFRRIGSGLFATLVCAAALLSGCSHFRHSDEQANAAKTPGIDQLVTFQGAKLAMLTPTTAPAQQEDRQALARVFTETLGKQRPDLAAIPLPATLSAINTAGLAGAYDQMYVGYKNTGLLDGQTLHQIAQAVGARYLIQLKLASFNQEGTGGMLSFMGLSLGHKQTADLRLSAQIWDGSDGSIVWERSTEQSDTKRSLIVSRTIKMEDIEKSAAEDLIKQLPH